MLNHEDEDTAPGKRLYSISYAWETIQLGIPRMIADSTKTKIDKEVQVFMYYDTSDQKREVQLYSHIDPETPLPQGRTFEYIVDRTIRIKQEPFCMVSRRSRVRVSLGPPIVETFNAYTLYLSLVQCIQLQQEESIRLVLSLELELEGELREL